MGFIPILGDAVDIIGIVVLYPYIGIYALAGLIELIPIADILPTFTAAVIFSRLSIGGKK